MSNPYVGEIRMFGGHFAPAGWAFCDGQLMPISENDTLFTLIGTTYGGDGQETFGLPDLRGRVPVHTSASHPIGEKAGWPTTTLTTQQIASHGHQVVADSTAATSADPADRRWAHSPGSSHYSSTLTGPVMAAQAVMPTGGNQPHENMMPFTCVSFIISLYGIFPTQS